MENEGKSTKVVQGAGHQRMVPGSTGVTWTSSGLMLATPTQPPFF